MTGGRFKYRSYFYVQRAGWVILAPGGKGPLGGSIAQGAFSEEPVMSGFTQLGFYLKLSFTSIWCHLK